MSIPPRLARKLQQTLGEEAAEDLVTWMEGKDARGDEVSDLAARFSEWREASRADLAELRQEVHAGISGLREEIRSGVSQLREETAGLRQETQLDSVKLRQEMTAGLARIETLVEKRSADLIKWSFVFWVGAILAIAVLAGVLR